MKFSPSHRKKSYVYKCCIKTCKSKTDNNTNISFHKVPDFGVAKVKRRNFFGCFEEVDKRRGWLRFLDLEKEKSHKRLYVCSLHFAVDDYNFPGYFLLYFLIFLKF